MQVHASVTEIKFGLWVNLAKNPRFKTIEIPELGFVSELPKSLALASIAVRMLHASYDDFTPIALNEVLASMYCRRACIGRVQRRYCV